MIIYGATKDEIPQPYTEEQMADIKSQFHPSNTANVNIVPYHIYDADEHIVGEWRETIDGVKKCKPVYEKLIINNDSIGTGDHFYNHGIGNFERFLDAYGWCNDKNGYMQSLPSVSSNPNYMAVLSNWSSTQYYLTATSGLAPITNCHIVVQYTKTTDEWQPV